MSDKSIWNWSDWNSWRTKDFLVWIPEELQQYTDTDPFELAEWNDRKKDQFDLILDCVDALLPTDILCDYDRKTEYYLHPETDEVWKAICDCGWEYCDDCYADPEDYGYKPIRDFDLSTLRIRDKFRLCDEPRAQRPRQLCRMVLNNEISWTEIQFDWFPDSKAEERFGTIDAVKEHYAENHWGERCAERSDIFSWNIRTFLYRTDYWFEHMFLFPRYCK